MAKMYPENFDIENTKSSAEKRLFKLFKDMPDTDNWTIMHSLAIANHNVHKQGECDFVAIIPNEGVFFLEVKGGRISFEEGQWYSIDRNQIKHKIQNPDTEANNAKQSIYNFICKNQGDIKLDNLLLGHGVVFPNSQAHNLLLTPEIADEQIADLDDAFDEESLKKYLLRLSKFWRKRITNKVIHTPNLTESKQLIKLLRPTIELKPSLPSVIKSLDNRTIKLTKKQEEIFEGLIDNERCVISGGAGTGKTIIAMNFAKAQIENKYRTGFFCYNKKLSQYLFSNIENNGFLVCDSFTEYMEKIANISFKDEISKLKSENKDAFYKKYLFELFEESFIENDIEQFDFLIVDEAQDLITDMYLEALNLVITGGLKYGKWCFFMDSANQNIYNPEFTYDEQMQLLKSKAFYAKYRLKENCRNSIAIIEKIDQIFKTHTNYNEDSIYGNVKGAQIEIKKYKKSIEELNCIDTILDKLINKDKMSENDIVILSPLKYENSIINQLDKYKISTTKEDGSVYFSTIQGFKGLESSVVILCDIRDIESNGANLLYVGMTRAKALLYIVAQERTYKKLILGG